MGRKSLSRVGLEEIALELTAWGFGCRMEEKDKCTRTKVMVFVDGTWCGQLTGTQTNVKILADAIAKTTVKARERFVSSDGMIVGCYYDGEGVQGQFSDYLLDGALGGRIRQDCMEAYKFVMEEFERTNGECEAWLIGLSRGSYTVRCVAGMINNCGLISHEVITKHLGSPPSDLDMNDILERAYFYYRDRSSVYLPNSEYMMEWKRHHSRVMNRPPVKFMGLFETVGALGIPSLNPGTGVDYLGSLNFYGKADEGASAVSGEVERVYQALAVHDRLTAFTPCHVKRDKYPQDFAYNQGQPDLKFDYITEELWFPGAHYDIGRQKFMFYKSPSLSDRLTDLNELVMRLIERGTSFCLTRLLRIPDIQPNYEYSAAVLTWMARKMGDTDPVAFGTLRDEVAITAKHVDQDSWMQKLFNRLTFKPAPLGNDAYDHLTEDKYLTLQLLPFAHRFLVGILDRFLLQDRSIINPPPPDPALPPEPEKPPAPPVKFHRAPQVPGTDPDIELKASESYRSRSYNSYNLDNSMESKT